MSLAYVRINRRDSFLCIIELFNGGKKISVMDPKGVKGMGWWQLGKALISLLVPKSSDRTDQCGSNAFMKPLI